MCKEELPLLLIGLTGWGDHDLLYPPKTKSAEKLAMYSRYFPVVEVDSSFYAVQPKERFARWVADTPEGFSMVVKAYQGMTGHLRGKPYYAEEDAMYGAFRDSLEPVVAAGKLKAVLFQYPPWFDCTRDNVRILREAKLRMGELPCALEFRHQSWFTPELKDKTLSFMREQGWIHSICDEPQAGAGSVPTVLEPTDPALTIVRMHGRDPSGWQQSGAPNWREVRYLYRYNETELAEWSHHIAKLREQTAQICIIFNNNSGGDAAANARQLMAMCGLQAPPLAALPSDDEPEQLTLFE